MVRLSLTVGLTKVEDAVLPLQSEVCQVRMYPHHGTDLGRGTELKQTHLPAKPKGSQTVIQVIELKYFKRKCFNFVEGQTCFR